MALLTAVHAGFPYITTVNVGDWLPAAGLELPDIGNGCAYSPDNSYLAVAHDSAPYLRIYSTVDWSIVGGTPTLAGNGLMCVFSADSTRLAVIHQFGSDLTVIDTSDWSIVAGTPSLPGAGNDADYNPAGTLLAAACTGVPYLRVIDTSDWSLVVVPTPPSTGHGCAFSPDGSRLAVTHAGSPYVTVLNTSDWSVVSNTPVPGGICYDCAFSPDGAYLAVLEQFAPFLRIIDTATWTFVGGTPNIGSTGNDCFFSPDGVYLAIAHAGSPYLTVVSVGDWSIVGGTPTLDGAGNGVAWSPTLNLPYIDGIVYDYAGAPVATDIHVMTRPDYSRFLIVQSDILGEFRITTYVPGDFWGIALNPIGNNDRFFPVTVDATTGALPAFEIYLPYVGALTPIAGNATKSSGGPADKVVMHAENSQLLIDKVVPDGAGDWTMDAPPGHYYLTYLADGCAPITHGPYEIE